MLHADGSQDEGPYLLTTDLCLWVRKTAYLCARRLGLTREDAEDCAGEFLMRLLVLDENGTLRAQHLTKAWLYRCADNYAKNCARALRRMRVNEIAESHVGPVVERYLVSNVLIEQPETAAVQGELRQRIQRAIAGLSRRDRVLLRARYRDGLSYAAIGAALGRREGTVREAARLLRQRLKLILERHGLSGLEIGEYLWLLYAPAAGRRAERKPISE